MFKKQQAKKQLILEKIKARIDENIPKAMSGLLTKFVDLLFEPISVDDLQNHDLNDLYGAILSFWHGIYSTDARAHIRVYNPDFEKHGWESSHTIIEVMHHDMPFMVDSVFMCLVKFNIAPLLIVNSGGLAIKRHKDGQITEILRHSEENSPQYNHEAFMYIEIPKLTDEKLLTKLRKHLSLILHDVADAVDDWQSMMNAMSASKTHLLSLKEHFNKDALKESIAFFDWLADNHFTFLGIADYQLKNVDGHEKLVINKSSALGILKDEHHQKSAFLKLPETIEDHSEQQHPPLITVSKSSARSNIHRPANMDFIAIREFNRQGKCIGERRFLGLFTSTTYLSLPNQIPLLRLKYASVISRSQFKPHGHAAKSLAHILNTYPRDDFFQATTDELYDVSMGIFYLQERKRTRLFMRHDPCDRFVSCFVYLPRDRFNTELRLAVEKILMDNLKGTDFEYTTYFSESILVRLEYIIYVDSIIDYDIKELESKIIEATRHWDDDLQEQLLEYFGEENGMQLAHRYTRSFPASYREHYSTRTAVHDIAHLEDVQASKDLELNFYKPIDDLSSKIHFKIYHLGQPIALSEMIPILENMGLKVLGERPFTVHIKDSANGWIHDFEMELVNETDVDIAVVKKKFQTAFKQIWVGHVENDQFNALVLQANLNWQEVAMIRAYAKYLQQIGFTFSQDYIEETFLKHLDIVKQLVKFFHVRFSPQDINKDVAESIEDQLNQAFDQVSNLDEDRILRRYLDLMKATVRTNFYQKKNKEHVEYIAFKISSRDVPDMPKPMPLYEIFVYSPRFEAIHLRHAKVARGGLRWSDRRQDFRTEILGLMKAQVVKNAVIVPSGAKGGFVPKNLPQQGSREEIYQEGVACYQSFISALIELTDNQVDGQIVPPADVIRYDDDDPYLVVAADKGTATFSDIANAISEQHGFWLGDAFASGGSTGYDHKKIGITARGAWESVKRHFREMDINIQETPFTVIGIGDMAGDVFGNGMLLSKQIKLVAAYNHMHIFVDPTPDPEKSYLERKRLFELPRSAWTDYDKSLMSKGGEIYNRLAKSITLSPEAQKALGTQKDKMTPNELISILIKAPVDLIWNGGIGTFVKASTETHIEVGDRSNDVIRVNANELRAKVIGEGGNLGMTQRARVEFALNGGNVYTDFIDNSAGVDCSDHEVNIKILLNDAVTHGEITIKQRNQLLKDMTDEVAELVLANNYNQTKAISIANRHSVKLVDMHTRYLSSLDSAGKIDRELEFLPDNKTLKERKLKGLGLAAPGIATLLAYSKTILNEAILASDIPDERYFERVLLEEFPKPLHDNYLSFIRKHSLRREIIATRLSNNIVNQMGFYFIYRMQDETGASIPAIVKAYMTVKEIFEADTIWKAIDQADNKVDFKVQLEALAMLMRLLRRSTRWLLRTKRNHYDIEEMIDTYREPVKAYIKQLPDALKSSDAKYYNEMFDQCRQSGLSIHLCEFIAASRALQTVLDVIEASNHHKLKLSDLVHTYFSANDMLQLGWLRGKILEKKVDSRWDHHTREALRDDLDSKQRQLAIAILMHPCEKLLPQERIESWRQNLHVHLQRWDDLMVTLQAYEALKFTNLFVAIRDLSELAQSGCQNIDAL